MAPALRASANSKTAAIVCGILAYGWMALDASPSVVSFYGSYLLAVVAYTLGVRSGLGWKTVLAVGLLFRALVMLGQPVFENDFWRYLWEGRVLLAGYSPYLHAPDDPLLVPLRTEAWSHIGFPWVPTCYPPLAEAFFTLPAGLTALRLLLVLCEVGVVAGLLRWLKARDLPPERIVLYAWHPLAVREIAGQAHFEPLALMFVVLSAPHAGRTLSAVWLGVAALAKSYALLLAPFWCRARDWPLLGAIVLIGYLPLVVHGGPWMDGMQAFADRWAFNGGVFEGTRWLLHHTLLAGSSILSFRWARRIMVGLFVATAALLRWRLKADKPQTSLLLLTAAALLSPVCNAWYGLWLVPLLALEVVPSALALTLLVSLAYLWYFNHAWAVPAMAIQSLGVGSLWLRDVVTAVSRSRPGCPGADLADSNTAASP